MNFDKEARQLAENAHCRYCDRKGLRCEDDIEVDAQEILEALIKAYELGLSMEKTGS